MAVTMTTNRKVPLKITRKTRGMRTAAVITLFMFFQRIQGLRHYASRDCASSGARFAPLNELPISPSLAQVPNWMSLSLQQAKSAKLPD
jgi:hypothetical protein